jgi:hypothetical protein
MDKPTPDQPTAEVPPAPERLPDTTSTPGPTVVRVPRRDQRVERRLQSLLATNDPIVAWTRGWVSREVRLHRLLAARTYDFAVLTNIELFLFSTGFFTRRPRRRVYTSPLSRVHVANHDVPRGRRLRISSRNAHPLWIELRTSDRATTFADELVARARGEQT